MPEPKYEHLGWKTFWIFVSEKSKVAIVLGLLEIAFILLPPVSLVLLAREGLGILFCVAFLLTIVVSWLEYARWEFYLDDDALRIRRGVLKHEETAIPYRQIQDIDIERDPLYQMTGTARLVILTAGHEDTGEHADSEGIIPIIDKRLAIRLQTELSHRANIQKVTTVTS